ncbi:MAG: SHOCT domain-containing protein [Thermoflexales bacterium]|nr:SHOCT domain-containing protein [Thermoflexales bacterium]
MCPMCGGWWTGWWGWGPWGSALGVVGLILNLLLFLGFLALLGLGIAWLARRLGRAPAGNAGPDPLEIARRRLAAGEITLAEFEEIRNRLRS